jgi:hypothetical protein
MLGARSTETRLLLANRLLYGIPGRFESFEFATNRCDRSRVDWVFVQSKERLSLDYHTYEFAPRESDKPCLRPGSRERRTVSCSPARKISGSKFF